MAGYLLAERECPTSVGRSCTFALEEGKRLLGYAAADKMNAFNLNDSRAARGNQ